MCKFVTSHEIVFTTIEQILYLTVMLVVFFRSSYITGLWEELHVLEHRIVRRATWPGGARVRNHSGVRRSQIVALRCMAWPVFLSLVCTHVPVFFNSDYSFCTLCMHCFIWSKRGHSLNTSVHFLFPVKKIQDYTELLFEPNTTTSINQKSVQYFLYLKFSSASLLRCDISWPLFFSL